MPRAAAMLAVSLVIPGRGEDIHMLQGTNVYHKHFPYPPGSSLGQLKVKKSRRISLYNPLYCLIISSMSYRKRFLFGSQGRTHHLEACYKGIVRELSVHQRTFCGEGTPHPLKWLRRSQGESLSSISLRSPVVCHACSVCPSLPDSYLGLCKK
ncbi:hypothetical protein DV515_00001661 [Chloebia gouldiae]|uniref:Uncharacterized protein n=1 Tax=Chloebia gouldiae TaxID=44316 RepID=A0A3L8SZN6_CHLGU|nr:hypothetical protein DV515_00001661 [Chloebia gouldiae]